jgi:hypothetical protein
MLQEAMVQDMDAKMVRDEQDATKSEEWEATIPQPSPYD